VKPVAARPVLSDVVTRLMSMEGFLKKKGAKRRNWKTRYFKLSEVGDLSYFKSKKDRDALGVIRLASSCSVSVDVERSFGIELKTDDRTWFFMANEHSSQQQWIIAIKSHLN